MNNTCEDVPGGIQVPSILKNFTFSLSVFACCYRIDFSSKFPLPDGIDIISKNISCSRTLKQIMVFLVPPKPFEFPLPLGSNCLPCSLFPQTPLSPPPWVLRLLTVYYFPCSPKPHWIRHHYVVTVNSKIRINCSISAVLLTYFHTMVLFLCVWQ